MGCGSVSERPDAQSPVCGDGILQEGEACDDGMETATCNADCTVAACGDGIVNQAAGEQCDEGAGDTASCDADCTLAECGDGYTNSAAGEICDDGGDSPECDGNCSIPECGDGYVNAAAGEVCDDGNAANGDICNATCTALTCVSVNGFQWCYNNAACGQPCEQVCAALGKTLVADDAAWFAAQDTQAECEAISMALGLGPTVSIGSYTYACLEDSTGEHTVGGGLIAPLYCSTDGACPQNHRTNMDQNGVACGPGSRRSVCPCQ